MNSYQRIDPKRVPKRKLYSGDEIPAIGMGTFGSDRFTAEQVSNAVYGAAKIGYRLFDCASVYENQALIGDVLKKIQLEGIERKELFIQSKVWNDMHGPGDVLLSVAQTLKDLKLDYLDMVFLHWPFRNYHDPGCDTNYRNKKSHAYIHEEFMETWFQLEHLYRIGIVRNIGTSNMTVAKMKLLLRDCTVKPMANEMELHPCFQQNELFKFCIENNIQPIGFSPIGSPTRPDRDKSENDFVDIEDPIVVQIAINHKIHPANVCINWAVQRGQIPIPFSVKELEYYNNLKYAVEELLSPEEMEMIKQSDKNCRLIKGQVFLWNEADDWHILWDEDEVIRDK